LKIRGFWWIWGGLGSPGELWGGCPSGILSGYSFLSLVRSGDLWGALGSSGEHCWGKSPENEEI